MGVLVRLKEPVYMNYETIIDDEEDDNDDNDGTQTWASGWLFYTSNSIGGRQIPYEVLSAINGC